MSLEPSFIELLCCPETRQPLQLADAAFLKQVNLAIAAKALHNVEESLLDEPLDEGLLREDGKVLYPVRRKIPVLLKEEGIPLPLPSQFNLAPTQPEAAPQAEAEVSRQEASGTPHSFRRPVRRPARRLSSRKPWRPNRTRRSRQS